jgi:hypothetical protein
MDCFDNYSLKSEAAYGDDSDDYAGCIYGCMYACMYTCR